MDYKTFFYVLIASQKTNPAIPPPYPETNSMQQSVLKPYLERNNAATLKTQIRCMRHVLFLTLSLSDHTSA